mmetsp:Transcript_22257/g.89835  ORF Transcript_22257/g.89835 Transcript_22257/m.89835 type:complete len:87 (+) Transcript_22257:566-826(+)
MRNEELVRATRGFEDVVLELGPINEELPLPEPDNHPRTHRGAILRSHGHYPFTESWSCVASGGARAKSENSKMRVPVVFSSSVFTD